MGDSDDDKPKRPGSMSDADRALAALKERIRRAAAKASEAVPAAVGDEDSMPLLVEDHDDDTPVDMRPPHRRRKRQTIQEFAEDIKREVRELRIVVDTSIRAELNSRGELAQRLVAVETKLEFIEKLDADDSAAGELLKLRADLTSLRVMLVGEDGKNGKISQLTEKAERGPKFIKRTVAGAALGILSAIIPSVVYLRGMVDDAAAARARSAADAATIRAELDAAKADRTVLQSQVLLLFRLTGGRAGRGGVIDTLAPTGATSP